MIVALRRRDRRTCEFKASLVCTVSSRIDRTIWRDPASERHRKCAGYGGTSITALGRLKLAQRYTTQGNRKLEF